MNNLKVALLPYGRMYINDEIFCKKNTTINRDNCLDFMHKLKEKLISLSYEFHTYDMYDEDINVLIIYRIDVNLKYLLYALKKNPNIKLIYVQDEPEHICPIHNPKILSSFPFDIIFSWNDIAVKKYQHFEKMNIVNPIIEINNILTISFTKKKFCCQIISNKMSNSYNELYSERITAIEFFSNKPQIFDLYGMGWEKSTIEEVKRTYKGKVNNKRDTMQHYKFSICYENVKDEFGLVTEKIFDCFAAGCVPVYYGTKNITNYIPKDCFIHFRDFSSYDELYNFMVNIDEKKYNKYLENIKLYLQSDKYWEFTSEAYVRNMTNAIEKLKLCKSQIKYVQFKYHLLTHVFKNALFYLKNFRKTKRFLFDLLTIW